MISKDEVLRSNFHDSSFAFPLEINRPPSLLGQNAGQCIKGSAKYFKLRNSAAKMDQTEYFRRYHDSDHLSFET